MTTLCPLNEPATDSLSKTHAMSDIITAVIIDKLLIWLKYPFLHQNHSYYHKNILYSFAVSYDVTTLKLQS